MFPEHTKQTRIFPAVTPRDATRCARRRRAVAIVVLTGSSPIVLYQDIDASTPRHRPLLSYVSNMAVGWAQDGAVQDQIDATVDSAVKRARSRLAQGESLRACEECGEPIPEARRQALPGVRRCVPCQSEGGRREAPP